MNCERFMDQLADALGNELPPTMQTEFDTHVASCANCRGEYQSMQDTMSTLRQLPPAPEVSIRRLDGSLVFGRSTDLRRLARFPLGVMFRYAAIILLAFSVGFATRGGSGAGQGEPHVKEETSVPGQPLGVDGEETFRTALANAHQKNPNSKRLTKLLMALHSPAKN
ncbi:MAG: zf-HC2 domain-containing protein [Planctomycetes bacterium]|nr:zf-HC2 domain-containing protein [Planctomycetota bacterium]